jgi:universal stress protein A
VHRGRFGIISALGDYPAAILMFFQGRPTHMLPTSILFCADFSANSLAARDYAIDFAGALGGRLVILHVINSSRIGYPSLDAGVPPDIQAVLRNVTEAADRALALTAKACCVHLDSVETFTRVGNPSYEIVRFARENGVGLIVMGSHGWTGWKHLVMGSTAENVVRSAHCPVLTVRSTDER